MDIRHVEGFGSGTFDDVIATGTDELKQIAYALRELIAAVHPGVIEVNWPHQKNAGFGVGPRKMSEQFCYVGMTAKHVNLGFYEGALLDDPAGLLQGTGKKLRHVKVKTLAAVHESALRALLTAAADRKR
jgi:hypothetical protein